MTEPTVVWCPSTSYHLRLIPSVTTLSYMSPQTLGLLAPVEHVTHAQSSPSWGVHSFVFPFFKCQGTSCWGSQWFHRCCWSPNHGGTPQLPKALKNYKFNEKCSMKGNNIPPTGSSLKHVHTVVHSQKKNRDGTITEDLTWIAWLAGTLMFGFCLSHTADDPTIAPGYPRMPYSKQCFKHALICSSFAGITDYLFFCSQDTLWCLHDPK